MCTELFFVEEYSPFVLFNVEHLKASEAGNFFLDINPILANDSFIYPLKTLENLWFSDVFRGYRNKTLT